MRHVPLADLPLWMESAPSSNPTTSRDAAEDIKPHLARLEAVVLDCIKARAEFGACDHEIAEVTGLAGNTVRPRRVSLVEKGLVKDAGKFRLTPSGRRAIVWTAA